MRSLFMQYLVQQAEIDPSLFLVVGDLGFSLIEPFKERYPNRFINAGIAEQNMIGVAAGLAMAGHNVYVYSIIPFVTMRCFEQIRIDLCYQNLPVKLIGNGSGYSYGSAGATHHGLEDISILRTLPNMTIVAPGCKHELDMLLPTFNSSTGPAYLCLGNIDGLTTYPQQAQITLGKAIELIPHPTQCIITTGNALDLAWQVQQELVGQGINIGLVSMPTVKPLDQSFLTSRQWQAIFTIDEHMNHGGIGEGIAHIICEQLAHKVIFQHFGINDTYVHEIGNRAYLKSKVGLCKEAICKAIMTKLNHLPGHTKPQEQLCNQPH